MHQRDYILRIIEQLGAALIELRKRLLGGTASDDEVSQELKALSGQVGFDIDLLRSFTIDSLFMFAAPGGEVEPSRCWLMAECLYVDGLQSKLADRPLEARASFMKARALYDLVRPGGAMLVGFPEAIGRIDSIDTALAELPETRPRRRRTVRPRRRPSLGLKKATPPGFLGWAEMPQAFATASAVFAVIVLQACVPATATDLSPEPPSADPRDTIEEPAQLIDCTTPDEAQPADTRDYLDVTIPVLVGVDGRVEDVGAPQAPRATTARKELDRAADLARSCTFTPARIDDLPVRSRATIRLRIARSGMD